MEVGEVALLSLQQNVVKQGWTWSLLWRQQLRAAQARGLESAHEPAGFHVSVKDMEVGKSSLSW